MQKPLAAVAIIGPWKPDPIPENSEEACKSIFEEAHLFSEETYGSDSYYWVTTSVDFGFGRYALHFCKDNNIRLVSIDTILVNVPSANIKRPFGTKDDLATIFRSRHAAIIELVDCLFIKLISKYSIAEDLVDRLRQLDKPFFIYNEENIAIEYKGDPKVHVAPGKSKG